MSEQGNGARMESISVTMLQRAEEFKAKHLYTPAEQQATYHEDVVREWVRTFPETRKPMWVRQTFEMGSEFGAAVDYTAIHPDGSQFVYGRLDVEQEIDVYVPDQDYPGGKLLMTLPFTTEGLATAITVVETEFELSGN